MTPRSHALPTSFQGKRPVLPNHDVGPVLVMGSIQPAPSLQVPPGVYWWGNKREYGSSRGIDFIVGSAGRAAKDPKVISFPRRWSVGCWSDWSQGRKVQWILGGFSIIFVKMGRLLKEKRIGCLWWVVFCLSWRATSNRKRLWIHDDYEMLRHVSTLLAGVGPLWFLPSVLKCAWWKSVWDLFFALC